MLLHATVKPFVELSSGPMEFSGFQAKPGGCFRVAGVNLKTLITYAYRLRHDQIIGGPEWTSSDLWEITAKAAEGSVPLVPNTFDPAVPDTMEQMVQALIEERFRLKLHRENRELPTFELLVSNDLPEIQRSDDQTPPIPAQPTNEPAAPTGRQRGGPPTSSRGTHSIVNSHFSATWQGNAVPLSDLAGGLAVQLRRAVVDKTNLKGLYDFKLQWMPDPITLGISSPGAQGTSASGPSLFTALQEQLGLKLERSKGPVEVLVIDSVSKPTEN